MTLSHETFVTGGEQTGVVLRDSRPEELATFIAFALDDGAIYRAEQVTALGPEATDWTSFRFAESPSGFVTVGTRTDDAVVVGGIVAPREVVPSYLARRILLALAASGDERAAFSQFDEHGDIADELTLHDCLFVDRGPEVAPLPGGATQAVRYDLLLDGEGYTSFWVADDDVIASNWTAGSWSYRAPDLRSALAGCPVPVAEMARRWIAGRRSR